MHILLLGLATAAASLQSTPTPADQDPEANPAGRESYLGREVARTMHWRGAPWLLRATREDEENGERLRAWLDVQPGEAVCDLGCGNGYHTLPLAAAAGPEGRVFAVDLQPEMLDLLAERADGLGLTNLVPVEATVDDPRLPEDSVDTVLMVDVYHELSHPVRVLGHVRRALREGGRVVLVEFRSEDKAVPIKLRHKMSKAQVIREMAANGFRLADETDVLPRQHAMGFEAAPVDPRLEARELAQGFVRAASGSDARVLLPYLAPLVARRRRRRGRGRPGRGARPVDGRGDESRPAARRARDAGRAARRSRWTPHGGARAAGRSSRGAAARPRRRGPLAGRRLVGPSPRALVHGHAHGPGPPRPARGGSPARGARLRRRGLRAGDAAALRSALEPLGLDVLSSYATLDLRATSMRSSAASRGRWTRSRAASGRSGWRSAPGTVRSRTRSCAGRPSAPSRACSSGSGHGGGRRAPYPHTGFWLATTEAAVGLARSAPGAGVCFNLCHYLRRDEEPELRPLLRAAAPPSPR